VKYRFKFILNRLIFNFDEYPCVRPELSNLENRPNLQQRSRV